jgi:hypothetical protein
MRDPRYRRAVNESDAWALQGWAPADLEANRAGRLSPAQIATVRARMRSYVRRIALWTSVLPVIALVGAVVGVVCQHEPGFLVLPAMAAFVCYPLLLWVASRAHAVRGDLEAGRLAEISGEIDGMFTNNTTGQARVRIGSTRMECFGPRSDQGWQETRHFIARTTVVRIYYLQRSRLIVAAESATRSSAGTPAPTA